MIGFCAPASWQMRVARSGEGLPAKRLGSKAAKVNDQELGARVRGLGVLVGVKVGLRVGVRYTMHCQGKVAFRY